MKGIELGFENPWMLLVAIPALVIILLPFFLLPAQRRKSVKKILPVVLHVIIAAFLVLALSGFHITTKTDEQAVMLVVDLSDSTEPVKDQIRSKTQEILDLVDETVPCGVVAFGNDQLYALELEKGKRTFNLVTVAANATDIDAALQYASDLLPSDKAGRLILLSDGKQTDGKGEDTARYLATQGVRLDAVYFDTTEMQTAEMQISSFSGPQSAYVGDEMSFTVELESNTMGTAKLYLYDSAGEVVYYYIAQLSPGSLVLEPEVIAKAPGAQVYHLVMETEYDTIRTNNESYAYVKVAGDPNVLIIADDVKKGESVKNILSSENTVEVIAAKKAPQSIVELCRYDEIVLSNVDYQDLPEDYGKLLDLYVSTYGKTLLMVGGGQTFMYGNMEKTVLEEMIPVTFTVKESTEGKSVALMLVLDCSNSMTNHGATYFSVAKQGAIKCVEVMTQNDYVGIVTFNSSAKLASPLIRATNQNKDHLIRTISGLATATGTRYAGAVEMAKAQLDEIDADVKHMIFLSDGRPSDNNYYRAVQKANHAGITVSTIGLGYSSDILEKMSEYGGGRYYYVENATSLPDIMLSETKQVTVDSLMVGEFYPVLNQESPLTEKINVKALPALKGFLGTTIKEDATAYLVTEKGHPLFASCNWGMGTVACFTGDFEGEWSSAWLSDESGQTLMRQMISSSANRAWQDSSLSMASSIHSKSMDLVITTSGISPQNTVTATVNSNYGSGEYAMFQTATGVYQVTLPVIGSGIYEMRFIEKDSAGQVVDYLDTALAVSYSAEYDAFILDGKELMDALCVPSGGQVFTDMEQLSQVSVSAVGVVYNPLILFSVISAVLLLADIAIRKLRWKDVVHQLIQWKILKP